MNLFSTDIFIFYAFMKLGDHPYITSAKRLNGWVKKMASFSDVQYHIYADIVSGWVGKSPKYTDVMYGWSLE